MIRLALRIGRVLDALGLLALISSAICLGASFYFSDDVSKLFFLNTFFLLFNITILLLGIGRLVELYNIFKSPSSEDKKSMRRNEKSLSKTAVDTTQETKNSQALRHTEA